MPLGLGVCQGEAYRIRLYTAFFGAKRLNPELLEKAAEKLAPFPRQRLEDFDSVEAAYHAGGLVAGSINSILAEEYCADLLAPVYQAYEDERAKILGKSLSVG